MKIENLSVKVFIFIAVLNYCSTTYAAPPKLCFQSEDDYEVYLIYGDAPPKTPPVVHTADGHYYSHHFDPKLYKAWEHGPAKRKAIKIIATVARNWNGTRMVVDASQSTTPSGKIQFSWTDHNTPIMDQGGKAEVNYYPDGIIGVEVTVTDPVCEFSAKELFQEVK